MPVKAKQSKVIRELYECDHGFLPAQGAAHFTEPFGFSARTTWHEADYPQNPKGLMLPDGQRGAEGIAADKLALQIADHLGIEVPPMYGRGSQLRIACARILETLAPKEKVAA